MKLIFMGTPAFTLPVLEALQKEHEIVAIYTRAPKPAGHGMKIKKSPVQEWGERHQIPVLTPATLKSEEEQKKLSQFKADAIIVFAYAMMIPEAVLNLTPLGCINIHPSLLPRWRGAAPVVRAIQAGDKQSGVSIMKLDKGWDTGPVYIQQKMDLATDETAETLGVKLTQMAIPMLLKVLKEKPTPTPQPESGACYAPKMEKEETKIDWTKSAEQIERDIRALGKGYYLNQGKRIFILKAQVVDIPESESEKKKVFICGAKALQPLFLQKEGKKPASLHDFLLGNTLTRDNDAL